MKSRTIYEKQLTVDHRLLAKSFLGIKDVKICVSSACSMRERVEELIRGLRCVV